MLKQKAKIVLGITATAGLLALAGVFVVQSFPLLKPQLVPKPAIAAPSEQPGEPNQTLNDYWVYVRLEDKYNIDSESDKGVAKKGDIMAILPVTPQFIPTASEKSRYAIVKVNGLTAEDRQTYTQSWEEDMGNQETKAKAYRKYKITDVDGLGLTRGIDPIKKNKNFLKNNARQKNSEDLIAYERGRKLSALKTAPKRLALAIKNLIIPPSVAVSTEVACINGTGDSNCTGETFNTLTLWEDATDYDVTASGFIESAYGYDDDGVLNDRVTMAGATTSATYYRVVTAPAGERHNGITGGFTIDPSTLGNVVTCSENNCIIEWLNVTSWSGSQASPAAAIIAGSGSSNYIIRNNLVHDNTTTGSNNEAITGISSSYNAGKVYNNIIFNLFTTGTGATNFAVGITESANASKKILNNTIYNITNGGGSSYAYGIYLNNAGAATSGQLINNAVFNASNAPFGKLNADAIWAAGTGYNACDLASVACTDQDFTNEMPNLNSEDVFTSLVAGSENLHLASTTANSILIDSGTDVSASLGCTAGSTCYDIDLDVVPFNSGDWDIGADEEDTASPTLDITGIAYANDGTTPLTGTARTVAVRANGGDATTAETNTSTGAYSISITQPASGSTITVYLNAETETANTITITDGSTAISANLVDDRVIIQGDNSTTAITIDDLVDYDSTHNDTDMLFNAVDGSPDTLTVEDSNQLYINTGDTFTPGGNTTVGTGGINIVGTWTATTTETIANAGNWANSGTFTSATGTVTFNPSSGTVTINTGGVGTTQDFNNLTINASGAVVQLTTNHCDIDGTLTITAGTLDLNGKNITTTTTFSNDATLKMQGGESISFTNDSNSGTTLLVGDGGSDVDTFTLNPTAFYTLTINATDGANDTFQLSAAIDVNDDINLTAGVFDVSATNYAIDIASGWTDTGAGTFTERTGTVTFSGTGEINANEAFNDVTLNTVGTIRLEAALDVDDDLTITTGTLDVSTNNLGINVGGDWSNSGTFTERSGTVTFDGSAAQAISNAESWYNLTINNSAGTPSDTVDVDPSAAQTIAGLLSISDGQWTSSAGDDYASVTIGTNGILKPDASAAITVSANWSNSGTFTHNNSDFTFDGSVAQTITGATTWDNLTINNNYATPDDSNDVDPSGIQTIAGLLNISDGQWSSITGDDYASVTIGTNGILKPDASAAITVSGDWTTTGTFTHNNSDITFDGSGAQGITGATTWDNLTINNSAGSPSDSVDVDPSAKQTIAGLLNISDGQWTSATTDDYASVTIGASGIFKPDSSASITVSENWSNSGTFTHNSGTVTFDGASGSQTINSGSSNFYNIAINNSGTSAQLSTNNLTLAAAGALTMTAGTLDLNALTLTLGADLAPTAGIIAIGTGTLSGSAGNYDLTVGTGGSVTQGTGTLSIQDLTISGTGTYTCSGNSAINVDGNLAISSANWTPSTSTITMTAGDDNTTINSSKNLYNLTINSGSNSVQLNTNNLTLATGGALTMTAGTLDLNALTLTLGADLAPTAGIIAIGTGTLTGSAGNYDLTVGTGSTVTQGTGALNIQDLTISGTGTYTCSGNSAISVDGNLAISSANWTSSTSTITMTGGDGNVTINSSKTLYNLTLNSSNNFDLSTNGLTLNNSATLTKQGSGDLDTNALALTLGNLTLSAGTINNDARAGTWDLAGNVNIAAGTLKATSGAFTVAGNWTTTGTFTHNSGTVTLDGSVAQTITGATTWNNLTIANTYADPDDSNDVDPGAKQTIAGTLNVSDGQWSPYAGDDYNIVTIGANGILKPDSSASITVAGNWTRTGTFTHNSGTVTFDGSVAQTITGATTWNNLTISNSVASPDDDNDVDPGAIQTVGGTLSVADGQWTPYTGDDYAIVTIGADGIMKPDASASLTVSGAWTNSGTFTHNSSLVTLDGASQSLTGSTTFYQLTKSVTSADTLTFDNTVTQTITNTLTLNGASGQLLSLRSDVTGSQFGLVLSTGGTQAISYLDVKDSDATGGVTLTDTSTSTDSGNNTNWLFTVAQDEDQGETPRQGGSALGRQKLYPIPGQNPIIIGNGSPFASSRYVMLYFDVLNASEMELLFNSEEFSNNRSTFVREKAYDLGPDDGLKKFIAKFWSPDNEVSNPYTAMVTLDLNPPATPIIQVPKKNQQFNTNNPTFFGKTEPNSKVSLKLGSRLYRFESPPDGSWSINITPALPQGDYLLEVRSEDWAGNVSPTISVPFRIVKVLEKVTPPAIPTEPGRPVEEAEEGEAVLPPFIFPPTPTGKEGEEYIPVIPEEIPVEKLEEYWFKQQEEVKGVVEKTTETIGQTLNNFQETTQQAVRGTAEKIGASLVKGGQVVGQVIGQGSQQLLAATQTTGNLTKKLANNLKIKTQQVISPLTKVFLKPDLTLNKLAKTIETVTSPFVQMSQKVRLGLVKGGQAMGQGLVKGVKATGQGLAFISKKTNTGLIKATQTTGRLAQNTRTNLFNQLKQLKPTPEPTITQELAQPAKPEEIPTLVPKTMPPDVVMVKTRKGNLNLARAGQIELLGGMKVYSFIRPSVEPKRVVARLIFNQVLSQKSYESTKNYENTKTTDNWQLVKPAQAVEAQAMEWQVLEKAYQKLQEAAGIYMAEIDVPQVTGLYTLQTEVELVEGGSKLYDLKAEVKGQGYVYRQTEEGKIHLEKVKISLYVFNPKSNQYELWPASVYDQVNPQLTNDTGQYVFLAPAGQYYLTIEKAGYRFYQSDIFELKQATPINKAIEIQKENWLEKLNPFK